MGTNTFTSMFGFGATPAEILDIKTVKSLSRHIQKKTSAIVLSPRLKRIRLRDNIFLLFFVNFISFFNNKIFFFSSQSNFVLALILNIVLKDFYASMV